MLFEQVWEPVAEFESRARVISRYSGCTISKKERNTLKKNLAAKAVNVHAITNEPEYDHITMKYVFDRFGNLALGDFLKLGYEIDELSGDTTFMEFEPSGVDAVGRREFNTIIFELDCITVRAIIMKDDSNKLTENILSYFTVAQIFELIDYAAKNNSVNCAAKLMEYKTKTFKNIDAFDMFVL